MPRLCRFLMSRAHAVNHRPIRPRHVRRATFRRTREQLELLDGFGALPLRRSKAVGPGVAAAEDDYVLVLRVDLIGHGFAEAHLVGLRQILHREVDALELAPGDWKIAR